MNTPALVSRMDQNALPQWNPSSPGYIGMQSGSDADQSRANSRFIAAARRYWWVVLLIWALVAIPTTLLIFQDVHPQYTATAYITIHPVHENVLNGSQQAYPFYSEFVNTQAQTVKSPAILAKAAEDPSLAGLAWFHALPDQVGYLQKYVTAFPVSGTQNINISFTHEDPNAAMLITNAVLSAYMTYYNDDTARTISQNKEDLNRIYKTTQDALDSAQQNLEKWSSGDGAIWSEQDQKVLLDVLASAKQTLASLQGQKITLESKLADAKSRKLPDEKLFKDSIQTDQDPQVAQWVQEHIRVQLADNVLASKHATPEHPDRVEYRKQLRVLDAKIAARRAQIQNDQWAAAKAKFELDRTREMNSLNADLEGLNQQIASIQQHVAQQETEAQGRSNKLQHIVDLKAQIADYKESLKRYTDRLEEIDLNSKEANVDPHRVPFAPHTPDVDKRPKLAIAANGFGLILGLGILVLLIKIRDRIQGADDLGQHYQPLVVGTVSHAGGAARGLSGRMSRKILGEEMRLLHANLLPPGPTQRRIMMVTSPTPSNGKTSIASQLALSLAKSGLEVLLIDADLRKRDLSTMFDVGFRPGLADLLQGKAPELIRPVELLPNLRLMGAGSKLERNPVELLQRRHFRESLNLLQEKFDCIVVDTPPTLVVADARLIARSVDEILCVVRAQVSSQKDVDQAIDALTRIAGKAPKIIVNGVAHRQSYYKYKFAYSSTEEDAETLSTVPAEEPGAGSLG